MLFFSDACVDRVFFNLKDENAGVLVVDGMISNEPGPYTIRLYRSSAADDILNLANPAPATEVVLFDDTTGEFEKLSSRGDGIFQTSSSGIRGVVGRSYHIRIEMLDGTVFESTPEIMKSAGTIEDFYFEFETYKPLNSETKYGFRIFLDGRGSETNQDLLRWRYSGTFMFRTYPEMHLYYNGCNGPPDPLPCSGKVFTGGIIQTREPCSCCLCWVNEFESKPHLSDDIVLTNGAYNRIELGFVPFDEVTFSQGKYLIRVEQMSLSDIAYEYWKVIRDQKEGATSLFQPSFGRIKSNIISTNSEKKAIGLFYATEVIKSTKFITAKDAPIPVPVPKIDPTTVCLFWYNCEKPFKSASRIPPADWE